MDGVPKPTAIVGERGPNQGCHAAHGRGASLRRAAANGCLFHHCPTRPGWGFERNRVSTANIPWLPAPECEGYTWPMIPFPKPRGFWDYALFASIMTPALWLLFRLEASDRVGWRDAVLACGAAVLFVFATILVRRGEKARWIAHPTWRAHLLVSVGVFALIFGAVYADAYPLHRRDITPNRIWHDITFALVLTAGLMWSFRRRFRANRQLL